jgi:hypothetical protein
MAVACHRLVYVSRAVALPSDAILDIVRSSERNNARAGLSGMLYYGRFHFAQVIEGEASPLAERYGAIERDPRHTLIWAQRAPVAARRVGLRLPMGYIAGTEARADPERAILATCVQRAAGEGATAEDPTLPGRLATLLIAAAHGKYPRLAA